MSDTDYTNTTTSNRNAINDYSFMHTRINTLPVIEKIENFLKGSRAIVVRENGKYVHKVSIFGKPLANENGINQIMNKVHTMINSQLVQGNIKEDFYYQIVGDMREDFAYEMLENCNDWGISDEKLDYITNTILNFFEIYLTRLINNEERKSYGEVLHSKETLDGNFLKKKGALASFLKQ